MIALRLRSGRKLKAERGGFAYGSPGFGYRAENKQLVPDDREQQAVRRIREMRDRVRACARSSSPWRPRASRRSAAAHGTRLRSGASWHGWRRGRMTTLKPSSAARCASCTTS